MKEENLKNEMLVGASMTLFETPIGPRALHFCETPAQ
jgi:hypothetical protein